MEKIIVENITKVKAIETKITLIVKEFLNEKQSFFREDYECASFLIKRHIARHNRIEVFSSQFDARSNIGVSELIINDYNITEFQNHNSIALILHTSMNEHTYSKLRGKSTFRIQKTLMRKQFESGNNQNEIDLNIEITNKLNIESINDTFIKKIDAIESTLSYIA